MGSIIKMIETKKNWQAKSSRLRRDRKRQRHRNESALFLHMYTHMHIYTLDLYNHIHIIIWGKKKYIYNLYSDCKVRIIAHQMSKSNRSIFTKKKIPTRPKWFIYSIYTKKLIYRSPSVFTTETLHKCRKLGS